MSNKKHIKGGNCPKSKSENWVPRKDFKECASSFTRCQNKKEIKQQLIEGDTRE